MVMGLKLTTFRMHVSSLNHYVVQGSGPRYKDNFCEKRFFLFEIFFKLDNFIKLFCSVHANKNVPV